MIEVKLTLKILIQRLYADVCEVRGVGLQVTRLDSVGPGQQSGGILAA